MEGTWGWKGARGGGDMGGEGRGGLGWRGAGGGGNLGVEGSWGWRGAEGGARTYLPSL